MDQFDEEADCPHDEESDGCGFGYLGVFLPVRFAASLHQTNGVSSELYPLVHHFCLYVIHFVCIELKRVFMGVIALSA